MKTISDFDYLITEYLITNCHAIFDASEEFESKLETSDLIEEGGVPTSESRDQSLSAPICIERPKSLGIGQGENHSVH